MKISLGKKSSFFADISTGLKVFPGDVVEITPMQTTEKVRQALKGGHLVKIQEVVEEEKAPEPPNEDRKNLLMQKTRNQIMEEFSFLESSDKKIAESKGTKAELVDFLLTIEKEYE